MTFPFVARAVESGELAIHGAWFAIHHGELHWRNKAILASSPYIFEIECLKTPL